MDILETIARAGVVGCGGAGFPTHLKLKGRFEWLIVNGAECEPLLWNDKYLMRTRAGDIVSAASALAEQLGIEKVVIALKRHYREETAALRAAIAAAGASIAIHEMESFYPAGDEQTIVYEVTGRVVPPAGLPAQVGAVVDNVATLCAIADAMKGIPLTRRLLTVTGEVRHPVIVDAPVGTSFEECLRLAGGLKCRDVYLLSGGPMMGRPVPLEEAGQTVVTKTTSGIIALPQGSASAARQEIAPERMLARARSACIQCSYCTQLCPRHLLGHPLEPHRIMRRMAAGADAREAAGDPVLQTAQLCCECGVCEEYACPMGLNPRRINAMIKRELAAAGFRYRYDGPPCFASPDREARKAPSDRVAVRVGLWDYRDVEVTELVRAEPLLTAVPLRMHIGRPSVPTVRVGDAVRAGDELAAAAEGGPGARICSGIDGRVTAVGESIIIERERM
ncbi:MAG: 4Fe-4S dicluster domain-containing protein [Clostridia bacterium]|nr:4Fe-4S dicluster domain-containing protein [Clostridia bacterium]